MTKLIDEVGNHYGQWIVIRRAENRGSSAAWHCRCGCGIEKIVTGGSLRSGGSQSCGCTKNEHKIIGLVGKRFGRWTITSRAESNTVRGGSRWWCLCDCGNTKVVNSQALRTGASRSCGCLRSELTSKRMKGKLPARTLPKGEASFNALLRNIKNQARERGLEWRLTQEQVRSLTGQPCRYCGAAPQQVMSGRSCYGDYLYNGLDREDNERGYEIGNVVPCCKHCNIAKLTRTVEEFRAWVCQIYEHFVSRENKNSEGESLEYKIP